MQLHFLHAIKASNEKRITIVTHPSLCLMGNQQQLEGSNKEQPLQTLFTQKRDPSGCHGRKASQGSKPLEYR